MKICLLSLAMLLLLARPEGQAQVFYGNFGNCGFPRPGLSVTWAGQSAIQFKANWGWGAGYGYGAPYCAPVVPVVRYVCYPAPVVNCYYGAGPVFGSVATSSSARVRWAARPVRAAIVPDPVVFSTPEKVPSYYVQRPLR